MMRLLILSLLLVVPVAPLAAKPNILFVFVDDQAVDTIRALGNHQIQTPTLDALVGRGFHFRNAYCQGGNSPAVCVPSRTQMLSGRSVFRTPNPNAKTFDGPTLGKVFREAGYRTVCISKPGNSFRAAHEHFETVIHQPHQGANTSKKAADAAIEFLQSDRGKKPFFIYFAPSMPHDPRTAEEKFQQLYDPAKIVLPANYMREQPFDIGVLKIRDEKLAVYPRDPMEMKRHLAEYYACITGIDFHLGRIIDELKRSGQLEETLIVYSSDQGLAVGGRHGLMGKQNLYEHFKSPMILAGPGIPKGQSDALIYLYDLFPTLCDYAGVPIPGECDGQRLQPVIRSEKPAVRDALFAVYMDSQRMVRDQRWKLLWYPKIGRFQLFDLQNDPNELRNLADKHPEQLQAMKKLMAQQQSAFGDKLWALE